MFYCSSSTVPELIKRQKRQKAYQLHVTNQQKQFPKNGFPINELTSFRDEPGFIGLHAIDNHRESDYRLQNYRTMDYTRNPHYTFPFQPKMHSHLDISEGQGAGMNAPLDSMLTRGEYTTKTGFNLREKISFGRYFDYLPGYQIPFHTNKSFYISTSPPVNPQKYYNGVFHTLGVNTRNYMRAGDETYRKMANLTNETRKASKVKYCF